MARLNVNILMVLIVTIAPIAIAKIYANSPPQNIPGTPKLFNSITVEGYSKNFTIVIKVINGLNVYGWQANLLYDPTKLAVLKVEAGDYLSNSNVVINSAEGRISEGDVQNFDTGSAVLFYATDIRPNLVLVGGFRWGDVSGVDGSGTVAKIVFGCLEGSRGPYYVDLGDHVLVDKWCRVVNQGWITIELNK